MYVRSFALALVVSITGLAIGQPTSIGLTGKTMLLAANEVKKELKLTKDQEKQIQGMMNDAQKNPAKYASMDMTYMTRGMDKEVVTFLTVEQNARLNELFWQFNGLFALSEPELCTALSLSEEVRAQAQTLVRAYNKATTDEFISSKGRPDKKKLETLKSEAVKSLEGLLTPSDLDKWKEVQGKPFKFTSFRK